MQALLREKRLLNRSHVLLARVEELIKTVPAHDMDQYTRQLISVLWPHDGGKLAHIQRLGWTHRPTAIYRDRCICNVCGISMQGWRDWHVVEELPHLVDVHNALNGPSLEF